MFCFVQSGRIHEDELGVLEREDAELTFARGLRARRDGGDLLPEQCVEQRGLADIGTTDDGDKAGATISCNFLYQIVLPALEAAIQIILARADGGNDGEFFETVFFCNPFRLFKQARSQTNVLRRARFFDAHAQRLPIDMHFTDELPRRLKSASPVSGDFWDGKDNRMNPARASCAVLNEMKCSSASPAG